MKDNRVRVIKNELSNNQLRQNVQNAIEIQSLLLKHKDGITLLLIEG